MDHKIGSKTFKKPACAKDYDPPDGEYLVHATDVKCLVSIFKTGLVPASLQREKAKQLADLRPAGNTKGQRTTVQFTAISSSRKKFLVRERKPLLLLFSARSIASSFDTSVPLALSGQT